MNRQATIAAALLPLCASPVARAQQNCTPIHFARGQSSAIVRGVAQSMDTPSSGSCYTLTTRRGQTATIVIVKKSLNDDTAFTIPDVIDNQDKYTFKTTAKTYTIGVYRIFAREPDKPFTMRVTVK